MHRIAAVLVLLLLAAPADARDRGVPVEWGHEVLSAISPAGDVDDYLYEGAAGSKVSFAAAATSGMLQPTFALFAPGGGEVSLAGLVKAGGGKAAFSLVLPATGIYTLRVAGTGGNTGEYSLVTKGKAPTSLKPPARTLAAGGQEEFAFHGTDLATVSVKITAPKDVTVKVLAVTGPDDEPVYGALDAFGPGRDLRAGTFRLFNGFGEYRLTLGGTTTGTTVTVAVKIAMPKPTKEVRKIPANEPRPAGVSPAALAPLAWITITGSGFGVADGVYIGDSPADAVLQQSATEIRARTRGDSPRDVPLDVTVRSPDGQENTLPAAVTVLTPPTIGGVSPTLAEPGDTVTVTGSGYAPGAQVSFGSTPATTTNYVNTSTLTAVVPEDLSEGVFGVRVLAPNGLSALLNSVLAVERIPEVSSVSPGAAERGEIVHVYGDRFTAGTALRFGDVATAATFVSPTELSAFLPQTIVTEGLTDVSAVKPHGSTATLADAIEVLPEPAGPGLLICGIISGPRTGKVPKAVELRATRDLDDLSLWTLRLASNGGAYGTAYPLAGSAAKGDYLYVAYESPGFAAYFGFAPTFVNTTVMNFNGNDAVALYLNGVLADVYGNPANVSSSSDYSAAWAYQESYGYRMTPAVGNVTFTPSEWTFGGNYALTPQGANAVNGDAGVTVPFGTWHWR